MSSDLTKSQRESYNIANNERKKRIEQGENDLIIKIIDGNPTIVTKKKKEDKNRHSKNVKKAG